MFYFGEIHIQYLWTCVQRHRKSNAQRRIWTLYAVECCAATEFRVLYLPMNALCCIARIGCTFAEMIAYCLCLAGKRSSRGWLTEKQSTHFPGWKLNDIVFSWWRLIFLWVGYLVVINSISSCAMLLNYLLCLLPVSSPARKLLKFGSVEDH